LDALTLLVVIDNESDILSSVDPGIPKLSEVTHLLERTPLALKHGQREGHVVFDHLCLACHGLSVLVTARKDATERRVLFDVGPDGDVWLANAERLGVDLATIELIFLSHWHFDHSGGLPKVLGAIASARAAAGLPPPVLDVHPDRPHQRGITLPTGKIMLFPPEPALIVLAAAGTVISAHAEPHPLLDGLLYGSGMIARATSYETGLHGHVTISMDRTVADDPLILDERFVAAHVRGRGVTVLSACSHAGIVNAALAAQAAFPGQPIDVLLGGYHLAGAAMEQRIPATMRDLLNLVQPALFAPGHCSGWRLKTALASAAPERYAPSVVGTRYDLAALLTPRRQRGPERFA
jgi:7,8-dihydropterin-6-yl-methyl-4-(beta-D-ribofuranosyl)aminobenzene 5'-phosphate synthase